MTNAVSGAKKDVQITLVPQGGRDGGHAPRHLGDRQVGELRHRQPLADDGRRSLGIDQSRARQPVGPLRSRDQPGSARGSRPPSRKPATSRRPSASSARARRSIPDKFAGVWAISGTYGAFTPLMYTPARVWSQQNQDSPFRTGRAAHPGRPLRPRDGGRRPHALRNLCAAGVEAVPARADDSPQLLGLQRRRAGVLRRRRDRRA